MHGRVTAAWHTVAGVLTGVVAAALGTVGHRGHQPWGLVAGLGLVLAAGVVLRVWGRWAGWAGYLLGVLGTVLLLSQTGPGGDVLVPAGSTIGYVWIAGAPVLAAAVAALPRRWTQEPAPEPAPDQVVPLWPAAGGPGSDGPSAGPSDGGVPGPGAR